MSAAPTLLQQAESLSGTAPSQAIQIYQQILSLNTDQDDTIKQKEIAIIKLGELLKKEKDAKSMAELVRSSRTILGDITKAKSAKIVRTLMEQFSEIPKSHDLQIEVCKECIEWCIQEKRIYLKQTLETRLIALYIDNQQYTEGLTLINNLLKELKRLDDKMALVEVQLLESRTYHALRNLPKSRAALTSARTYANSIYCPPLLQAALDMQSGILHAEDKDYKTAYSYFYETMETYSSIEDVRAILALKYMLLCKIMLNSIDEVHLILNGKLALKYASSDIEAMRAVTKAYENRSLQEFEKVLLDYHLELNQDPIIRNHLAALYDTLLEQNLCRCIDPYSRVEISHIAKMIRLPVAQVEAK
jgi:26S proteasome regulatory subunit N6